MQLQFAAYQLNIGDFLLQIKQMTNHIY